MVKFKIHTFTCLFLLLSATFSPTLATASSSQEYELYDHETGKNSGELILALHRVNLVQPRTVSDANNILQSTVFKQNRDYYRDTMDAQPDWALSSKEAKEYLNTEYSKYKTIQPNVLPTAGILSTGYDFIVCMGNETTSRKNLGTLNYAQLLGYRPNTVHFLFKGDEQNVLEILKPEFPKLLNQINSSIWTSNASIDVQVDTLNQLKDSGKLAPNFMTISTYILFKRQNDLAQNILTDNLSFGGFCVPNTNWMEDIKDFDYISASKTIFDEMGRESYINTFLAEEKDVTSLDDGELIQRRAIIQFARSDVQLRYARALNQIARSL